MIPGGAPPPDRAWWLARLHPATRLGALPLALLTCLLVPAWAVPLVLAMLAAGLRRGGLPWGEQGRALLAWWPVGLLVVLIHAFTTVAAAPLGHFSGAGAARGAATVGRVAASLFCLRLFARTFVLGDLVAALAWWGLGRVRGAGFPRLAVALAVALGAAPAVAAEGRRVGAVLRLRRGAGGGGGAWRRWRSRVLESIHLAFPLLEGLFRRAEALTLSLRWRLPRPVDPGRPPWRQLGALMVWLTALVALAVFRGRFS